MTSALAPSEMELALAAVTVPSFFERGLQAGDLVQVGIERLLVVFDHDFALAGLDGHRDDFAGQRAVLDGGLGALERLDGVGVHLFTGQAVLVGRVLGKGAHQAAGACVFQTIKEHVVLDLAMTHAQTAAGLLNNVRRVGHALHAAGNHDAVAAGLERVVGLHHGFHAGAAQLVDSRAASRRWQACVQARLAGRALLQAGGQDAAHNDLVDVSGGYAGTGNRFTDADGAQINALMLDRLP